MEVLDELITFAAMPVVDVQFYKRLSKLTGNRTFSVAKIAARKTLRTTAIRTDENPFLVAF